jgi:hypothetical protein
MKNGFFCVMFCIACASLGAQSLGDVNKNGSIDIVDALLTAQYYVGLNPANFDPANADVNCSGLSGVRPEIRPCHSGYA